MHITNNNFISRQVASLSGCVTNAVGIATELSEQSNRAFRIGANSSAVPCNTIGLNFISFSPKLVQPWITSEIERKCRRKTTTHDFGQSFKI